jgi:hypothetical protein
VFRDGIWLYTRSSRSVTSAGLGMAGDVPLK